MHDSYELLLFLNGHGDYYIEHHRYHMKRGNLLLINSNEIHRAEISGNTPYERVATHFSPDWLRNFSTPDSDLLSCFEKRPVGERNLLSLDNAALEQYLALADRMQTALSADHFGHDVLAAAYLVQILVLVNICFHSLKEQPAAFLPPLSSQIMGYINKHLMESITVCQLADYVHLDPSYLSRKFREQAGCSLQEYIILKRIAFAKDLLRQGKSVTEACQGSGFNDYANFIRTFKKHAGIPPGQYGRRNQTQ
ncbi:MAG: AraC family transcriptional regulator [Lachnospiraceae bacterium]|nr:AraC family transcriptional regulator [Lachnospiraceae bacterium]